ncbi:fibronectin type III domain-containing protein [Paenibacillus sp. P36]|uniref:fibronectin type III domain-containing protein n=1 Tax=Paenibacillus sp. P36 TaxID=3342538 RepID=UPI0038B266F8
MKKKQLMKTISMAVLLCMLLNIIPIQLPFVHLINNVNAASLPAGWAGINIGGSGGASSYDPASGTYTITGSGTGLDNNTSDSLYYVYTALPASGKEISVTARVTSVNGYTANTRVGPMIRANTDVDSQLGAAYSTGSATRYFSRYWNVTANANSAGAGTSGTGISVSSTPFGDSYLMKVVKDSSNRYRAWFSVDGGKNWTAPGSVKAAATTDTSVPMLVGFAVGTNASVTVDHVTINNTPSRVRATAGDTEVNLAWDEVGGANSYKVMMSTTSGGPYTTVQDGITGSSYTVTGLTNNTSYYFVVAANLNYYEVSNSKTITGTSENSQQVTVTPMTMLPAAPTGLTAVASNGKVDLSWTPDSRATSYTVKMGANANGPYTTLQSNITASSFTKTGLTNGTTYYFVVSATNALGEGANSIEVNAAPQPDTVPDAPIVTAVAKSQGVNLSWPPIAGALYYRVDKSTTAGTGYTTVAGHVNETTYSDTGLTNGTTYYYKVYAVNSQGTGTSSSEVSAVPSSIPQAAPAGLSGSADSQKATLTWQPVSGADYYTLKMSATSGGPFTTVATNINATSYTVSGLTNDQPYYFVVSGSNSSGDGPDSLQISVTPVVLPAIDPTLPAGWNAANIHIGTGASGVTSYDSNTGTFTITGSGLGTNDKQSYESIFYLYKTVNPPDINQEVSITARITALSAYSSQVRVGPMIRQNTDPGTYMAALLYNGPTSTIAYSGGRTTSRTTLNATASGGGAGVESISSSTTPFNESILFKAVRRAESGSVKYKTFISFDGGKNWTNKSTTGALPADATAQTLLGLAVAEAKTATIDHVTINEAPSRVRATKEDGEVKLDWDEVGGAASYKVMMSTTSGGPYTEVMDSITGNSYTWSGLTNNTPYYFVVAANLDYKEGSTQITRTSGNSEQVTATPAATPPAAPTGLAAVAGNAKVTLNWTVNPKATSYSVKMNMTSGGAYTTLQTNIIGTSFTATGLANGTTYNFVVSASNANGESSNSSVVSATPQPALVSGLSGTMMNGSVDLSWNSITEAVYYNLKRSNTSGSGYMTVASNVYDTVYSDTGITIGSTYYYVVSAVTVDGEGPNSAQVAIKYDVPGAPAVTRIARDQRVDISWPTVANAVYYQVARSVSAGTGYITVADNVYGTSYTDTGLTNGTTYYYKVYAANILGSGVSSAEVSAVPMLPPQSAPAGLSGAIGPQKATLTWESVAGATSYNVKISETSGGPYILGADNINATNYNYSGLTNDKTYYFVVSASNNSGEGPNSSEVSVTPKALPAAPMTPLLEYGDQYITVYWLPVAGANYYTVKTSTGQIIATNLTGNSYTITGLNNGIGYSYKVSATGVAGQTSDSSTVTASPVASPAAISVPSESVISDLLVYDTVNKASWSVVPTGPKLGGIIYGDRTTGQFNFGSFPEKYSVMEHLVTAGNSKSFGGNKAAAFKLKEDAFVYVGFDSRLIQIPQWAASWEKTDDMISSSDVSGNSLPFSIYRKFFAAGSKVQLGANGQTNGVINYFALIEALPKVYEMDPVQQWVNVPDFDLSLTFIEYLTNVSIKHNGNTITESESIDADSTFNQQISLAEGMNTFEINYTRSNGMSGYKMFTVDYDTVNPVISMTSVPAAKVADTAFNFGGSINEDAYITVKLNGQVLDSLFTVKDAAFEQQVTFIEGYNTVQLLVKDKAGNESIANYNVWYSPLAIGNVAFKDLSGNTLSRLEASNSLAASVEVTNKDSVSRNVQLIVVLYDSHNQVKLYSAASDSLAVGKTKQLYAGFKLPSDITGYKVKVFIWDSLKGMKPLETETEFK